MASCLSFPYVCEMKKLPALIVAKEFAPDEIGQVLEYGIQVLDKQPWRPHVFTVLCDTRRFKFFKITRTSSDFIVQHTPNILDRRGWELLRLLVCQTSETLGYMKCSIEGWTVGEILGIGGTAVVAKAHNCVTKMEAVVKLYTGNDAQNYRNQEELALTQLQGIPNIPQIDLNAPTMTVSGRPILIKYPVGFSVGDGVFPFIGDFVPLVDAIQAMHSRGWLHNDVAPANIVFRKIPDEEPKVLLNDFGSATNLLVISNYNISIKSRSLFYGVNSTNSGYEFGVIADLRALVLSIFVLTQPNSYDKAKTTTMNQLKTIAILVQPWKNMLNAAEAGNYDWVRDILNSTRA